MEPDDGICLSTLLLEVDVDPAGVVAGFESAIGTVPRSGSNLSQLSLASNASTVQFDATSRQDPFTSVVAASHSMVAASPSSPCGSQLLLIEVFCTFNGWIVRIAVASSVATVVVVLPADALVGRLRALLALR